MKLLIVQLFIRNFLTAEVFSSTKYRNKNACNVNQTIQTEMHTQFWLGSLYGRDLSEDLSGRREDIIKMGHKAVSWECVSLVDVV
jgi:hypothetical protein